MENEPYIYKLCAPMQRCSLSFQQNTGIGVKESAKLYLEVAQIKMYDYACPK